MERSLPLFLTSQLRPSAMIVQRISYLSYPEKPQPLLFIAIVVALINKDHITIINNNSNDHILNKSRDNNSRNNSNSWICIPLPSKGSRKGYSQLVVDVICSGKKTWNTSHFNWLGWKQMLVFAPPPCLPPHPSVHLSVYLRIIDWRRSRLSWMSTDFRCPIWDL